MRDTEHQISDYWANVVADHPLPDVDSIFAATASVTIDPDVHGGIRETESELIGLQRSRRPRSWLVAAAAAAAVVVLIGGLALLTRVVDDTDVPPVVDRDEPEESLVVDQVEPEEPPVAEEEEPVPPPSTTLPPEPVEPAAPITGMAWQRVSPSGIDATTSGQTVLVSAGDRFLYFDGVNRSVGASFDGINWTSRPINASVESRLSNFVGWQEALVGFGCGGGHGVDGGRMTPDPGCVSVIHADGSVAGQSFDAQINDVGIGPSGIVVIATDNYDENGLQYANEDEMAEGLGGRDINDFRDVELTDGVLHIETSDGQVGDYVIADHGYTDSESQVASGWFSQDGQDWTPIPDFPAGRDWDLIGTEDGFVAISDDGDAGVVVWHSSNGLDWRELGPSPGVGWPLMSRWGDGAIVVGTESVWHVSGRGIAETPLSATFPGEYFLSTSGNVGLLVVDFERAMELNQVLYSPDGQEWITTDVPPEMRDLELTIGMYHNPIEVVATDTNVILLLFEAIEGDDGAALVWYRGTPITD